MITLLFILLVSFITVVAITALLCFGLIFVDVCVCVAVIWAIASTIKDRIAENSH